MEYIKVRIKKPGNAIAESYELEYNSVMGQEYLVLPDGTEIYFEEDEIVATDSLYEKDGELEELKEDLDQLQAKYDTLLDEKEDSLLTLRSLIARLERKKEK